MKRNSKFYWLNTIKENKNNPYEMEIELMEQPITEPLPDSPDITAEQMPSDLPSPGVAAQAPEMPQAPPPSTDVPPGDEQQQAMPGMEQPEQVPKEEPEVQDGETQVDFEQEKIDYMNMALKQDYEDMTNKLMELRDVPNLSSGQYKFIEDNIQILSLLRDVDFAKACKKIYKRIKDEIASMLSPPEEAQEEEVETGTEISQEKEISPEEQQTIMNQQNQGKLQGQESKQQPQPTQEVPVGSEEQLGAEVPEIAHTNLIGLVLSEQNENSAQIATGLYAIISEEIEQFESIKQALLKLPSFYALKSDLFRKIISALTNGTQIGSGGTMEDIFIPTEKDGIGIKIATRISTSLGNIEICKWNPQLTDPETFLSESELDKLNVTGSPEEKSVLRKRVIIESIAFKLKDKFFIMLIVDPNNGTRREIGINFETLMKNGWQNGVLTPHLEANVGSGDCVIKIDGEFIDINNIVINYIKTKPDQLDDEGLPVKEEVELMQQKDGRLYFTIDEENFSDFIQNASEGIFYSEKLFDMDQENLKKIQRCIPNINEILLKKC